jgi:hypothetical protein
MATKCNCGGKTINIKSKKPTPKKVRPKKPKKITDTKRSARLSRIATKKAKSRPNPYAKGCKCS